MNLENIISSDEHEPDKLNLTEEVFVFPASFAQQRLWFMDQLVPGNHFYNVVTALRLTGTLNLTALEQTISEIVRRHETLRTNFKILEGEVKQIICTKVSNIPIRVLTPSEGEVMPILIAESQHPFDLSKDQLIRVLLLQLSDTEHILLLNLHHIICDDWSMGVLIGEIKTLYTAFCENKPSTLPDLLLQYADFAEWQHQLAQGDGMQTQLSGLRASLQNLSKLNLPTDRPKPPIQTYKGAVQYWELSTELSKALEALSQKEKVTLFMTLLTAFKILLYRYTNQEDIVIGSPIANRNRSEIENLIGFFVNTLVLRTNLGGNPTFVELLARVKEVTLKAYTYQDFPFEKLVEALQPERNNTEHPLFQVVFGFENSPMQTLELPGLKVNALNLELKTTRFDLEFHVWNSGDDFRSLWGGDRWQESAGIRGAVCYNTDMWNGETIKRLLQDFQTLLSSIIANPHQAVGNLPLLSEAQRQQILIDWNNTKTDYPRDQSINQLFELQVSQNPEAIAVIFAGKQLSYRELNNRSNQLAHYLIKSGVVSEQLVGICVEPSLEMIIGILGILKAGGAYLPLDPSYPLERLSFMIQDAGVSVIITQQKLIAKLPSKITVCLDSDRETLAQESEKNPTIKTDSQNLAYVIYTSGSTGTPKGVAIPHKAVNRLVCNTNYIKLEPQDKIAQVSNISFDAATFEIWGALLNGAQLVIIPKNIILSPEEFAFWLRQQHISVLFLTTALVRNLARFAPQACANLKYLLFGGEKVEPKWVRKILERGAPQQLIHVYGPTENTTFSSYYLVEEVPESVSSIPIGKAITNTEIYILDQHFQPVPIGVIGELYLRGDGLAQGYLNRTELTQERFINNYYKTGDLAFYRADGNIEFMGRLDEQVKIRGYRLELGEIEALLCQHEAIAEAVVIVLEEIPEEKHLVAYIVTNPLQPITSSQLRQFLKQKLPEYMIPSAYVMLDALPLTPNGKVDRHALPAVDTLNQYLEDNYIAPSSEIEAKLVEIWAKLLGKTSLGVCDNFFELGGHSLLATQLISRIRDVFKIEMPLSILFDCPTVAGLARYIETSGGKSPSSVPQTENAREEVEF